MTKAEIEFIARHEKFKNFKPKKLRQMLVSETDECFGLAFLHEMQPNDTNNEKEEMPIINMIAAHGKTYYQKIDACYWYKVKISHLDEQYLTYIKEGMLLTPWQYRKMVIKRFIRSIIGQPKKPQSDKRYRTDICMWETKIKILGFIPAYKYEAFKKPTTISIVKK